MRKYLCAICMALSVSGCATDLVGDPADLTHVEFPAGMVVHPNGRYAYVVGTNFDLDYRATDGGAIYVVDLEQDKILDTSKRMGSFGTNIVLSSDGRHGYTVTRSDDALVWFEISEDGSKIWCPNEKEDSQSLLKCRIIVDEDPTFVALTRSYREITRFDENGQKVKDRIDFDLIMIAQLRNAYVTAMTVRQGEDGSMAFSHQSASFVNSASELIWVGGERFLVTGRAASNMIVASPAINAAGEVVGLYEKQALSVPSGLGVYQGRGMTLDPTHRDLYLVNQYPNSLLKFDVTGISTGDIQSDRAVVTQMMMLPSSMSKVQWIGSADAGMLYVTDVGNDEIYIIDPRQMEIASVMKVGDGPYEMTLVDNTLYVLHFSDGTIWALDVSDPESPTVIKKFLEKTSKSSVE